MVVGYSFDFTLPQVVGYLVLFWIDFGFSLEIIFDLYWKMDLNYPPYGYWIYPAYGGMYAK